MWSNIFLLIRLCIVTAYTLKIVMRKWSTQALKFLFHSLTRIAVFSFKLLEELLTLYMPVRGQTTSRWTTKEVKYLLKGINQYGEFVVELLNWKEDKAHYKKTNHNLNN